MNALLKNISARLFADDMPLEQRIFNMLCMAGLITALIAAVIRGLIISSNIYTFFILLGVAALLALCLLMLNKFSVNLDAIVLCMAPIPNILFPLTFFTCGGIDSGMTAYFVLSLALFFILLKGWVCAIMACWNIATVLLCYYLGYTRPELITPLRGASYMIHLDSVLAIIVSGGILCLFIKAQINAYIEKRIAAQRAVKARSDFLANMSHEIRTPLNAIIGISEQELRSAGDQEARESLKKMYDSGVSLLGIINDILDISKMESGLFEIFPEKYDFASLVLDTISLHIGCIGKRPIEFRVNISKDVPASLYGDELGIKQVLNKLLSNAFKYTEQGFVELAMGAAKEHDGRVCLNIIISDSGKGMADGNLEKIFSEYNKLDLQATAVEGIGLGLPICKKLLDMMGGTIGVKSGLGHGSTFFVSIPQDIVECSQIGEDTANRLNSAPAILARNSGDYDKRSFDGHVLVVDDMEINLEIAQSLMEEYGLKVDIATSGKYALELISQGSHKYDLIFMDHMMPEMSGGEVIAAIRAIGGEYAANVPIIGLTARERSEGGSEQFFNVVQDLLAKPVDVQRLEKIFEKWLAK